MMMLTPEPSTWHVLVIDDKTLNLKLAQAILTPAGAQVTIIDDPQQALSRIAGLDVNVILLDLAMPGISGWEVQKQIRAQPALDSIPVIAFTALAMYEDVERGRAAGFDGYIVKPFRVDTLLQQLRTSIESFLTRRASKSP